MKTIDKIIHTIAKINSYILVILVLFIIIDIFRRYLLNSGSITLQEIEWHLFDIIFLSALSITYLVNENVRVDIFYANFTEKTKAIIDLIGHIFIIIPFISVLIYYSLDFVSMSFIQQESSSDPGGLAYRYLIKGYILFAFFLLILTSFSKISNEIETLKKGNNARD